MVVSLRQSLIKVVSHHKGLSSRRSLIKVVSQSLIKGSFIKVVSHQGGLSVSHKGSLSSRWSFIKVVSHQGSLSVSHQGGLLSRWSLIIIHYLNSYYLPSPSVTSHKTMETLVKDNLAQRSILFEGHWNFSFHINAHVDEPLTKHQFSSVHSLDPLGHPRDMRDDSAEILFQSFLTKDQPSFKDHPCLMSRTALK